MTTPLPRVVRAPAVRPAPSVLPRLARRRIALTALVTALALVAVLVLSAAVGQFPLSPEQILASLLRRAGLASADPSQAFADGALWNVRLPRLVLGALVGAALGVAGALMQGVFGNPLAEPGVVGVSSGCAVGAAAAIVLHVDVLGSLTVPAAAFVAGIAVTALVYALSRARGRTRVLTLVLTGIAVTAVANAAIAFLVFLADAASRDQIVFWQLGSLNGATWTAVGTVLPFLVAGLVGAFASARGLDLLALGETAARHVGLRVEGLRVVVILCVALLTAAAVAYAGVIAFVGLIVPHLFRLLVGPAHRALVPLSAVGGALLVSASDVAARTVVPFADLPIGMFTALVGGPVFFVLVRRTLAGGSGGSGGR